MSRKSNTEQRRGEIAAALLAVMAETGYEKATIQSIARKAGLASGLIHYHFQSKEEILLYLVHSLADLSRARFKVLSLNSSNPVETLKAYIDARLATGEGSNTDAVAAWVIIGAEAVRQPQVREIYQVIVSDEMEYLTNLLKECFSTQGKKNKSVASLAAALISIMEGAYQLASAAGDVMPKGYAAATTLDLITRYIDAEANQ